MNEQRSNGVNQPHVRAARRTSPAAVAVDGSYRDLFENAVFGIFRTTAEGSFVDANDALASILGYESREELMAAVTDIPGQLYVDPDRRAEMTKTLEERREIHGFEAQLQRKDGSPIWVSLSARVIKEPSSGARYEGIVEDITDRKSMEEALRASEERFYKAFYASPAAKSIVRLSDRRFIDVNDAFLALLGYTREEIIGETSDGISVWANLEDRDRFRDEVAKHGSVRDFETTLRRKDGSLCEVLGAAVMVHVEGELCVLSLLYDITGRKQAEVALREREARLAALLDTAADGIISIGQSGTIQSFNHAACRIFGYTEEEVLGRNVNMLMPSPYAESHDSYLRRYLDTGDPRIIGIGREVEGLRKDGTTFPLDLAVSEVRVGDTVTFTGIVRDISERKRAEASLAEQRQRLEMALHAGKMGAWEWDVASGRVHWSETLEAIHGLEPGAFGGTFEDYLHDIHPEDKQRVVESISAALDSGHHEIEYRIICPDRSERWLSARGELIRDPHGQPERMIGLCMDTTARKRAEAADRFLIDATALLAASSLDDDLTLASLARLAVPHLGDWCDISVLEDDGSLKRIALAHGDPEKMQLAEQLRERFPFDPDASHGVANVLRTGQSEFYPDLSRVDLDRIVGNPELIEVVRELGLRAAICAPLIARGRTLGAITLATAESGRIYDESDLALAEELARRAALAFDNARLYAQLARANEAKDEFLGLMSHELRTPITTIYGGVRMLRSRGDRLDVEQRDHLLSDVEAESERLFRMVEDLLALARVDLGQRISTEPVMLQRIVGRVCSVFQQRRPGRSVNIKFDDDVGPVGAQPTYVEQVLRNLLSNADKYSPSGEPIEIAVRSVDGGAEVVVRDYGPGIPEQEAELIFERFFRSTDTARQAGGAGLGLTVCKRLIEAQGGQVWARNTDGGGLETGFFLPKYKEVT